MRESHTHKSQKVDVWALKSNCLDTHMSESGTQSFQSLYDGWLKLAIPPPGGDFTLRFQFGFPGNGNDAKMLFACIVTEYTKILQTMIFWDFLKQAEC